MGIRKCKYCDDKAELKGMCYNCYNKYPFVHQLCEITAEMREYAKSVKNRPTNDFKGEVRDE